MPPEYEIRELDVSIASDDEIAEYYAVDEALDREAMPDYPVMPLAQALPRFRFNPDYRRIRRWVARTGAEPVGLAWATFTTTEDNREHAYLGSEVLADHRRRGLGSALLATALSWVPDDRTVIDFDARMDGPGEGFLTRLGAERKLIGRQSACPVVEEMRPMLEGWVEKAAQRADGYRLITWDGPCPDDLLDEFVKAKHVMNSAPLEDFKWDDDIWTVDKWRDEERTRDSRGFDTWTAAAVHTESGEIAGYTELNVPRHWHEVIYQEDTGVWPHHRERGLGRWLKASLALRVLDECPEARFIETWNAHSNEPMLNINVAMGFAPVEHWGEWQIDRSGLSAALDKIGANR